MQLKTESLRQNEPSSDILARVVLVRPADLVLARLPGTTLATKNLLEHFPTFLPVSFYTSGKWAIKIIHGSPARASDVV